MFSVAWFRNKRVTVMGLGTLGGGLGVAKWLVKRGARLTVTDLRDEHALAASIKELDRAQAKAAAAGGSRAVCYVLGKHDEALFTRADMVIRNPAVPREHPLLALAERGGVPVESDISLFLELCPFPVTGITGTKGKTTTTTLLAAICKAHDPRTVIGGNIRISPMDSLDGLLALAAKGEKGPPVILELSSWQLETLGPRKLSPRIAIVTNILEDHLNRYDGIEDYAAAKELIVANQRKGDVAIMNADDRRVVAMTSGGGRRLLFSTRQRKGNGCFLKNGRIVLRDGGETAVMPYAEVRLPGLHNRGNVLAAVAAAYAMGVPHAVIRSAVGAFKGVPDRLETVAVRRGVTYVNDTTATAPDASIAGMQAFPADRIVLIAGGADKNLTFDDWAKIVKKRAKHLVLFEGTATPKMEAALAEARADVPMAVVGSMRDALAEARRHARKGDIILLSPGCASFGVFKNEFDRGDQFVAQVKKIRGRPR